MLRAQPRQWHPRVREDDRRGAENESWVIHGRPQHPSFRAGREYQAEYVLTPAPVVKTEPIVYPSHTSIEANKPYLFRYLSVA